jgi:hypothetical protein
MKKAAPSTSSGTDAAFSISIRQLFKALIADDSICPLRHSLNIKTFVLLHELEMEQIAFRKTVNGTKPHQLMGLI